MSKSANPAVVGTFVIGAILLCVAILIVFGGGRLFEETCSFVLYFEDSLSGLDVGAPVEFKGVKVGVVSDIRLVYDMQHGKLTLPVTIKVEPKRVTHIGEKKNLNITEGIAVLVNRGLRAQLEPQSFLTGKLKIILDDFPNTPVEWRCPTAEPYPEIPTVASPLTRVQKKLEELPLTEIALETQRSLHGLAELLDSGEARQAVVELKDALVDLRRLINHLDTRIEPLAMNVDSNLTAFGDTLTLLRRQTTDLNNRFNPLISNVTAVAENLNTIIGEGSPYRQETLRLIEDWRQTARSLRALADYLEQHPESIWQGKGKERGL